MLHKEIPFLRICVPLCFGIIFRLYLKPGTTAIIVLAIICFAGLIVSILYNKRLTNTIFGLVLFITMFLAGIILYDYERESLSNLDSKPALFTGTIEDYPEEKEKTRMLTIKLSKTGDYRNSVAVKGSIVIYQKKDSLARQLVPGDILMFRCTPAAIVNRGNPYEFDYRFYMESRGIKYYAFVTKNDILSITSPETRKLKYKALIIRNNIIGMYEKRGITGKRLALVAAITLGEKEGLDPEQKQNFIKAGVMHIMAVSGLHAMILSLFIFNILFFMKERFNILRVIITVLFLWAFAFVTGLTASVLRATLMFSFLQAGILLRRKVNGINSILASAFILILIRPSVIFDAGFLLSYSAVLFIIGFYSDVYNLVSFRWKLPDIIWQSAAVTIVAQAGTLPLTIMLFNRFPTLFLITNSVIVPLSSVLVITGCIVPLFFPLVSVSGILAIILDRLTWLTEYLTAKAAAVPWSTIENIGLTLSECISLFILISVLFTFLLKKPRMKPVNLLAALLVFVIFFTIKSIRTGSGNELVVYNTPGYATIGVKRGKLLEVFSENPEVPREVLRHSSVLGLRVRFRILNDSAILIKTGSRNILVKDQKYITGESAGKKDILILTGQNKFYMKELFASAFETPEVILAVSGRNIIRKGKNDPEAGNRVRSVKETGAIRIRL